MRTRDVDPILPRPSRWVRLLAPMLLAMLAGVGVVSCGGSDGIGSGGTGTTPVVSNGTVSGFGSIVVDGGRFDDRGARVEAENQPGTRTLAEARLGQRVEVEAEADGTARVVRLQAQVRGRVDALTANGFVVLGQAISVNNDAASGPVTQFGDGYASAPDVRVGDAVEVHGVVRPSGTGSIVQATRVDRLAAAPTVLKVVGVVADPNVSGTTTTFRLGSLTVSVDLAAVEPRGYTIAAGRSVVVFGRASNLSATSGSPTLVADRVTLKRAAAGATAYLGGVIAGLDAAAKTFSLDGVLVSYPDATLQPAGSSLADGRYVQVRGSYTADNAFIATLVTVRDGSSAESELKGTVTGYDAATGRFMVRDVAVTMTDRTSLECSGGLANGRFVEIHGRLGSSGVVATEVHCEDEPAGAVVERDGVAGTPSPGSSTFELATSRGGVTVRWTADTYFGDGLTVDSVAGEAVEVQGYFDGSVLVAQKVKRDD
jgi:hypothetical protein